MEQPSCPNQKDVTNNSFSLHHQRCHRPWARGLWL